MTCVWKPILKAVFKDTMFLSFRGLGIQCQIKKLIVDASMQAEVVHPPTFHQLFWEL